MKKIVIPLPAADFDPSEAAITWKILKDNDFLVYFATPEGDPAKADYRMLEGTGLWIFKRLLMARKDAVKACLEMYKDKNFQNPLTYKKLKAGNFDGLILPGGHAQGMKTYLASKILQKFVSDFFKLKKSVGAICHGVVLAARSKRSDGKSCLYGYKTTALLKKQEIAAHALTRVWLGNYYRTYPETVQSEVMSALEKDDDFISGPAPSLKRDSATFLKPGFAFTDRNYVSARWPGDVYNFVFAFMGLFKNKK